MKKNFIFALIAITLAAFAACKSKHQPSTPIDSSQINAEGIDEVYTSSGIRVLRLQDKASEMSADLFKGYNDTLLAALLPDGATPSSINTFLVSTLDHKILFDAGLGTERGGNLLAKLAQLNIRPEDIDAVCLTHLHTDHIGGLLKDGQPVFPNATLFLSVEEFEAWSDGGVMASRNEVWKQVLANYANSIQPFTDGIKLLDGLVECLLAPGHTPGHSVYRVDNCLFAGDLIHAQDLQIKNPQFCASFDNDPDLAAPTREKFLNFARENALLFCDAHCYTPFLKLND